LPLVFRIFFFSPLPYTNDIGTIQEDWRITEKPPKYKHLLIRLKAEKYTTTAVQSLSFDNFFIELLFANSFLFCIFVGQKTIAPF
jgi:hypothetical protein